VSEKYVVGFCYTSAEKSRFWRKTMDVKRDTGFSRWSAFLSWFWQQLVVAHSKR
jgi:hypothetical protein